jgi:glucose-6-phosphate isomerase
MCAVSTNLTDTAKFGIKDESVFGFWDWVGGRFSVSSAVGVLPLSLYYGFNNVQTFLSGLKSIDEHFRHTKDIT